MYHKGRTVMVALRPKQQRFVEEYLIDLNATQAALRAGYSAQRADAQGYENLRKPEIAAAIREAQVARSQRTAITADHVLLELAALAFSDMREVATWGPNGVTLKASEALSEPTARAVHEVVSTTKTTTRLTPDGDSITEVVANTKIRLHNKLPALEALGRHLDLFRTPTEDEEADEAFIRDFIAVVLRHVTDRAAQQEIQAVIEAHRSPSHRRLRNVTPNGTR
jgi:phage terminase small subunit